MHVARLRVPAFPATLTLAAVLAAALAAAAEPAAALAATVAATAACQMLLLFCALSSPCNSLWNQHGSRSYHT